MSVRPVAIVTGAGSGLGEACARELAELGYDMVLLTRSDAAEKVARELGAVGLRGSVTEVTDLERTVQTCLDKFGRIDAVLNNAGSPPNTGVAGTGSQFDPDVDLRLLSVTDKQWQETYDTLLMSVVRMSRLVTSTMAKNGGGSIVNMSSFAQKEPSFAFPVGACIRMALAGYCKLYADSHGYLNIRMNNILPGFIDNYPLTEGVRRQIPMARSGTTAEIAKTIAFLFSKDSGYITGQSIVVDGGLTRSV